MPAVGTERDLLLSPHYEATTWSMLDLVDDDGADQVDLAVAAEGNSLRQALLLRLLTPVGALAELGHAAYGSRLHEIVGRENDATTRQLARAFVLEAVEQERRVGDVVELRVDEPDQLSQDILRIHLAVAPADGLDPIALGIAVSL